jgi:hypothetical protein
MPRAGNNPKRRIVEAGRLTPEERAKLATGLSYVGSGHHKRYPADYRLTPPVSPRPWKSICDGIRIIPKEEASQLIYKGIINGMFSEIRENGGPKYVWSVDDQDEAYEAKTDPNKPGEYHGYRLEEEDAMRDQVRKIWKQRCPQV